MEFPRFAVVGLIAIIKENFITVMSQAMGGVVTAKREGQGSTRVTLNDPAFPERFADAKAR